MNIFAFNLWIIPYCQIKHWRVLFITNPIEILKWARDEQSDFRIIQFCSLNNGDRDTIKVIVAFIRKEFRRIYQQKIEQYAL